MNVSYCNIMINRIDCTFNGGLESLFLFVNDSVFGLEGLAVEVLAAETSLAFEHLELWEKIRFRDF